MGKQNCRYANFSIPPLTNHLPLSNKNFCALDKSDRYNSLPFPSLPFHSFPFPSLPFPPSLPSPSIPFNSLPFRPIPFPSLLLLACDPSKRKGFLIHMVA